VSTQYIITDNPGLTGKIQSFSQQINAKIIDIEDIIINPSFIQSTNKFILVVFYLNKETILTKHKQIRNILTINSNFLAMIVVNAPFDEDVLTQTDLEKDLYYSNIEFTVPPVFLARNFINIFSLLQMRKEGFELQYKFNISTSHISKLTRIGMSLGNEKDFTKLLRDILFSAREICIADGGSLYLVEKDENGVPKNLRFKVSALDLKTSEFLMPINKQSISGFVAFTGQLLNIPDAYNLPPNVEYRFNSEYDKIKNYYSKSMLVVPMKNHMGEVIGVIQLINKKRNFNQKLTPEQMKGSDVTSFDKYSEDLVMSVAGQAAVAIQNNNLIQDIEKLFEGFVTASVSAIESRDPTTSGHSFRVAEFTVGLAKLVDSLDDGMFKDVRFTYDQMREIRYASLLHDFGKVGVREKVLVKSKKLESYQLDIIKWRFYYLIKDLEAKFNQKKLDYLKANGSSEFTSYETKIDSEFALEKERLSNLMEIVIKCNEPTVLEQSSSNLLDDIAKINYEFVDGSSYPLITEFEYNFLSIKKGSLDLKERLEMESHVEHTFQFLSKIPWTDGLKSIPKIAHAHHEKLNGKGYPRGLLAHEIPIQSKMMTIADIYDALTDKDRPYKKAIPVERALDILKMEVKDNHVDNDLLNVFINGKIYEILTPKVTDHIA
jgi:HD-GYP domain-containing protein (c-di-GMP phosphodiesterase class II)